MNQTIHPPLIDAAFPQLSGVVALTHLGVIRVEGADAASFLQGQLTQDVVTLGLDEARLAAFCNAKGRMQASFVVFRRSADDILLVCSRDLLATTLKRLSMFVMRAKAKLSDASAEFSLFGLAGSDAESIALQASKPWAKADLEAKNIISLPPAAGVARALVCAPAEAQAPTGSALDLEVWHWLMVQSGLAMVSQPIFEAFVPQMLNYESIGGVNFKKGCYPGQEVVARSQFRGTLKRRTYLTHTDNAPAIGQEVFHASDSSQPCGLVAACAANPSGGFDALVSMQTSAGSDAAYGKLTLGAADGPVLSLLTLPYELLEDI
jgi:folate-binding protein YgfZ